MRLNELLDGVEVKSKSVSDEMDIAYIASDHRNLIKNSVFVAIKGTKRDGNDYICKAIEKGCNAIVTENRALCNGDFPYILVNNSRRAISKMWSNFYKNPSKNIKTVAITGTNGKTSSAYFLYNILRIARIPCALISTIGCFINGEEININGGGTVADVVSAMTTPDPEVLYCLYNKMKKKGVKVAVIEASSHALKQERLAYIDIEIGAFTNLSSEHLDFHKNIDDYFKSKEKLFDLCKTAIINYDDEYGKILKEKYDNAYTYGLNEKCDFCAERVILNLEGCKYRIEHDNSKLEISTEIIGEFTVYNTLLAASCALLLGVNSDDIEKGIKSTISIKGRMQQYRDKPIYIDYAHTPVAMENAIKSIKKLQCNKRIIVLFGCGGDRDKGKRAKMGEIATSLADLTVITSDNPRTENPIEIINDIKSGIIKGAKFIVIPERKDAIKHIAMQMTENDVLLLLGKGHEEYEITIGGKNNFSETKILDEVFSLDN